MKIVAIILSGGSGTRLWPLSRKNYPKQYIPLVTDKTMLQETILRIHSFPDLDDIIIVCNNEHRFLVAEQCKKINLSNYKILLEPVSKNTCPAITAATIYSLNNFNDALFIILSADNIIDDINVFYEALEIARKQALENKIVTFGIVPTHPNTGYGYIKFLDNKKNRAFKVEKFIEKPKLNIAKQYLKSGNYLWNSGMFMFKGSTFINELRYYSPETIKWTNESVSKSIIDLDFVRLDEKTFQKNPSESIDYALMEKSSIVSVVPLNAGWSDVGSWKTLYEIGKKDENQNILIGDVITKDTNNSFIHANNRLVTTIGINDLIIVDTPDATLIAKKNNADDVKFIVKELQEYNRSESEDNRKVFRPWGWYDSVETGENFQVKRLHVYPKAKLSIQMHFKRAEHWVVVAGTATVLNGEELLTLKKGESTYIPIKTKHSLENKTDEKLEIIEVQSGVYLGEDDIIRFQDIYGRT